MTKEEIIQGLKKILHEGTRGRINVENITGNSNLVTEEGLDSIEALDLLLRTEEVFGITIDDEDLSKELFKDFSTFTTYVYNKTNG